MHPLSLSTPRPPPPPARTAVWQKGFRPFFFLAGAFACVALPVWLVALSGAARPGGALGPLAWHSHEMVFGYAVAVVAGFLLTAVEKWTGRPTVGPAGLKALVLLWLAGRAACFSSTLLPPVAVAVLDAAFLPALCVAVGRPILRSRNRRNYGVLAMLAFLATANLITHLDALGVTVGLHAPIVRLALDVLTLLLLLISARIIPSFTRNATRSTRIVEAPRASAAAIATTAALTLATALRAPQLVLASLALAAAALSAFAARRWGTLETLRHPMLWILHAGYFWIVVALGLRGLAAAGLPLSPSAPLHALTVGSLGALTLGMMSRVTLGHTGRLIVSSPLTTTSFALITFAALIRVVGPELSPRWILPSWHLAGSAWCLAFAAFLGRFTPFLFQRRIDNQPG